METLSATIDGVTSAIPVVGHVKGAALCALGRTETGKEAMGKATRSSVVMGAGIGGFVAAGPVGAAASGIAAGAGYDSVHWRVSGKPRGRVGAAVAARRGRLRLRLPASAALLPLFP